MRPRALGRGLALLALTSALATPVAAQEAERVVTFRAPVDSVRLARDLMAQGFRPEEDVEVAERTVLFVPPLVIPDVRKVSGLRNPELRFLISYFQANFEGTATQLVDFWNPPERGARLKLMQDPEAMKRNRDYFAKFPGITVLAIVYQPATTTIVLGRGMGAQSAHLKRVNDRLHFTATPDNELSIAIIEASFVAGSHD